MNRFRTTTSSLALAAVMLAALAGVSGCGPHGQQGAYKPAEIGDPGFPTERGGEPGPPPGAVIVELINMRIDMPQSIPAGRTTFWVRNKGTTQHNMVVVGNGVSFHLTDNLAPGATATFTTDLAAGTYDVYCPLSDHKAAGMNRKLTVQ